MEVAVIAFERRAESGAPEAARRVPIRVTSAAFAVFGACLPLARGVLGSWTAWQAVSGKRY